MLLFGRLRIAEVVEVAVARRVGCAGRTRRVAVVAEPPERVGVLNRRAAEHESEQRGRDPPTLDRLEPKGLLQL